MVDAWEFSIFDFCNRVFFDLHTAGWVITQ